MKPTNRQVQQRIVQGTNAWEREDFAEALRIFDEVLELRGTFPDVHNKRGLCLALLGRMEEALAAFDRAIELAPTYAEAHVNRGIVLNDLGRSGEAGEALAQAGRIDTRDGNAFPSHVGNQIAETHAQLGDLYLLAEKPGMAAEQFRAALQVRPRFIDVRTKLAEALIQVGELNEAREELDLVLDKDPGYTDARLRLGLVLHRLGDQRGAVRAWEQCVRDRPDDFRARAYLTSARGTGVEGDSGSHGE